jgi:hypothetical protein
MRSRSKNIFWRIVNNEDSTTELLCNLFQFDEFKNIFLQLLCDKGIEIPDIDFDSVNAQCSTEFGRPDIVIEGNDHILAIENKTDVNRELTSQQPEGYLKFLVDKPQKNKAILFLIPKGYKEEEKIKEYQKKSDIVHINIIYWEEFLQTLKASKLQDHGTIFKHFIELINGWFGYETITFSKEEYDSMKYTPKLLKLIDNVAGVIGKSFKTSLESEVGSYGYRIIMGNTLICWFGCWYELWEKKGHVLICSAHQAAHPYGFSLLPQCFPIPRHFQYIDSSGNAHIVVPIPELKPGDRDNIKEVAEYILAGLSVRKE